MAKASLAVVSAAALAVVAGGATIPLASPVHAQGGALPPRLVAPPTPAPGAETQEPTASTSTLETSRTAGETSRTAGGSGAAPRGVIPWIDEAMRAGAPQEGTPPFETAPAVAGAARAGAEAASPRNGARRPATAAPSQTAPGYAGAAAGAAAPRGAAPPENERGAAAPPAAVEVAKLPAVVGAGAGVLAASETGLPAAAWSGVAAADAVVALDALRPGPLRSVNRLTIRLLSAAAAPPREGDLRRFFAARLDALSRFGAADRAAALAERAGADLITLGADAALISGREEALCAALIATPDPSLARIYCQAVSGDSEAAALAIEAGRALGPADEEALALLEAVVDPALTDALEIGADAPDPLRLAALRFIGAPLQPDFARTAPLAYAPAALAAAATPRARLEALERLEASGAVETDLLREAFGAQASAESGGVWGRVEAYLGALEAQPERFQPALEAALAKAESEGRRGAMARLLAPEAAARGLPIDGGPDARYATRGIRDALREGGEGEAAAALSRAAGEAGAPAEPPDALERALDRIAAPGWRSEAAAQDAAALAKAAARGSERAAFAIAALRLLDQRAATAPTPAILGSAQRVLEAPAAADATLAEPALGARLATSPGLAVFGAVRRLSAPTGPGAEAELEALRTLVALGYKTETRAIALEIAMRLRG